MQKAVMICLRQLFNVLFPMRHWIKMVTPQTMRYDFIAGMTNAVIVLPQGIAYAVIAGLPPVFGLYSAIVVQIVSGFWGSSRHMVTGPAVALSIVVPSIVANFAPLGSDYYIQLALLLTLMVGIIQLFFGLFQLGGLINFISHTVILGFTAGAGVLIITSQLPTFLGIHIASGLSFIKKIPAIYAELPNMHWASVVIALITILSAIILRKINRKIPYLFSGMVIGTIATFILGGANHGIPMLGSLPSSFPHIGLPLLDYGAATAMFPSAVALALLGLIEAASISKSIAMKSHQAIDGNQEFVGQGLGNIAGSLCSGYVGSGSFNRSAMNYDSGARTPFSLLFCALIVLAVLVFIPWVTKYLPLPVMAGAILLSGYNLFAFKHIALIVKTSRNEIAIFLVTFLSTLLLNLEFAIYAGVILALILYLTKTSHPMVTSVDFSKVQPKFDAGYEHTKLNVIRLDGSLYFGAIDHVQMRFKQLDRTQHWQYLVILAEGVNIIDVAGLEMLLGEKQKLRERGGDLYLIGLKPHLQRKLNKSPYWKALEGDDHLYVSTYIAFRNICLAIHIENYRQFMKHLFRDYNHLSGLQRT